MMQKRNAYVVTDITLIYVTEKLKKHVSVVILLNIHIELQKKRACVSVATKLFTVHRRYDGRHD